MYGPDVAALRTVADHVERTSLNIHERSRASTAAVQHVAWSGPRRDAFVLSAADLAARAGAQTEALRALATDLRALAAEVEQRLAALARIEAAVKAELARMLAAAKAILRAVEQELLAVTAVAAVVPGLRGVEHGFARAKLDVDRLTVLIDRLPPSGDLRWESIAHQLGLP
jgi:uncharacterized protein YukE